LEVQRASASSGPRVGRRAPRPWRAVRSVAWRLGEGVSNFDRLGGVPALTYAYQRPVRQSPPQ
jgi:hypothetical protein